MTELTSSVDLGILVALADIVWSAFSRFFARFHWLYLLSALMFTVLAWRMFLRSVPADQRRGFLAFLFPRDVWLHRSALLDLRFVMVDKIMLGILLGLLGYLFLSGGDDETGAASDSGAPLGLIAAYTVTLLLTEDFLRYWAHRLMHTNRFLWQFHKVHHSAEVLIPFSQMRTHPVNGLVNVIRSGLAIGLVTGTFMLIWPGDLTAFSILGVNAGRFLFNVMGSNLRHSHVWLSFGPVLSRIFISPAQHQIHHSGHARHLDKNFGSQFALWDWMFGSLYVPREREDLALGIGETDGAKLRSVRALYLQPFKDAYRLAKSRRTASPDEVRAAE